MPITINLKVLLEYIKIREQLRPWVYTQEELDDVKSF